VILLTARNPIIRWSYLVDQWDRIQAAIVEHLQLTLLPVTIGFVLSAVLAAIGLRYR
jgi:ABC-type arginine/histidine transport system permease subunit